MLKLEKERRERLEKERAVNESQIQIKYQKEAEERDKEHNDKLVAIKQESDNAILNNYRDFFEKLSSVDSSTVIRDGVGFINLSATKKRNKELIAAYKQLASDITNEMNGLKAKLENSELTKKQREEIEALINLYKAFLAQLGIVIDNE